MQLGQQGYDFEAQPRAVQNKTKYREVPRGSGDGEKERYHNLMFDRRVVRGNTHSSNMVRQIPNDSASSDKPVPQGTTTSYQRHTRIMTGTTQQNMLMTPRDVEGRSSISTMTEDYIEILSDKPEQRQAEAQTDFLLNKPAHEVTNISYLRIS